MISQHVRLIADENFRFPIVQGVRRIQPAIDIQTANEAGIVGMLDPLVLETASTLGGILVTHDERTMPQHFAEFLAAGRHSPGVLLIPQETPIRVAIEALHLVWYASEPEEWVDRIDYLP